MTNLEERKIIKILVTMLVVGILLWELLCSFKLVDTFLFPAPSSIFRTVLLMWKVGELQMHVLVTLKRFMFGFILGSSLAFAIGFFYSLFKKTNKFLELFVYFTYPIPRFALLPFLLVFFGTGIISKVIFISLGAFFPCVINTINGIKQIDKDYLEVAAHYGAKGWKLYKRVIFPGSLPYVFTGLQTGAGLALTYTILIEFLGSNDGVGALMWLSLQTLRMDKLFLGAIIVSLINILVTYVFLNGAEKLFVKWNK